MDDLRAHELRQRPSRRLHPQRGGHRAHGAARASRSRVSSTPAAAREVIFTRNTTESINLVAHSWGERQPARRRRHPQHRDGASQQHRAVADARRSAPARASSMCPSPMTANWTSTPTTRLLETTKPKLVALTQMSNVLGTLPPVERIIAQGARGRRAGPAGWRAERAASAGGRARAGLRLPGVQRPQDAGTERASASSGGGASCWRRCHRSWAAAR